MIKISKSILDGIIEQAKNELPNEACGLLAGKEKLALKQIAMTLIANYHSHPQTPSRPSKEDIRLAYDPNILYIIVSLASEQPIIKAFQISNGIATEEIIEIDD